MRNVVGCRECPRSGEREGGWGVWRGGPSGGIFFFFFLSIFTNFPLRKPKMVSTYHYVTDSISFLVLNDLLSLSSANVNSFLNDVSVSCGVLPFEDYLSLFSCNCDGEATPGDFFFFPFC